MTLRLEHRLCAAVPIISRVVQREHQGESGIAVDVVLDPQICRARAFQQGLPDGSVSAAAISPRVQKVIDNAVQALNETLPPQSQVVHYQIK